MALRNAFDNLSTEEAIRRLANLLTFSRDSGDRIRVIADTNTTIVTRSAMLAGSAGNSANGATTPIWYDTYSPTVVEPREVQRLQMRGLADNVRKNRWTY